MSVERDETVRTSRLRCLHDGTFLVPLAGTPHWFRCGAEGWKHYFYRGEGPELIDVDTNRSIPEGANRPVGRPHRG